jgi:hypothetical protein
MEWAIHIASAGEAQTELCPEEIDRFEPGAALRSTVRLAAKLIEEYFGPVRFTRCAYGNEFCEHLIPDRELLKESLAAACERGLRFTFLTPYVSDAGIDALRPLLDLLDREGDACEVVFNDWGVLNLLRRDYPNLIPVQGRLMNKSLRDPRITGVYGASDAPATTLVALRRSNLDCASYTRFLRRLGVEHVELDNLPQGVDLSFVEGDIKTSLYMPFGFISTSRVCMAAGIHYLKRDKFQPGAPCHHECQASLLKYTYTNSPFDNRDQEFYLKGNTYFYTHTEAMMRAVFEQSRAGLIDRLVFQPRMPMTWERIS